MGSKRTFNAVFHATVIVPKKGFRFQGFLFQVSRFQVKGSPAWLMLLT